MMPKITTLLLAAGALFVAGCPQQKPSGPANAANSAASSKVTPPTPVTAWSNDKACSFPQFTTPAHGKFRSEPVTVTTDNLPAHGWVKIRFKLLVLGGWDGSNLAWGPDIWSLCIRGGEQLAMSSFSNIGAKTGYYVQSHPDDYPWGLHYAFTGATPLSGKPFARPDHTGMALSNCVYPFEMIVPHRDARLTLDFQTLFNDPSNDNQDWAIQDFEVTTLDAPVALADEELNSLWTELKADAVPANAAMWRLISGGEKAETFLIAKENSHGRLDGDELNMPEGLRLRRLQKALRIIGTKRSIAASNGISMKVPEQHVETVEVAP
jgi:hypothetical protein